MASSALFAARGHLNSLPQHSPSSYLHNHRQKLGQNTVVRMDGKWVHLSDDRKIIDASGDAGVMCIGANDQRVKDALNKQLNTGVNYAAPLDFVTIP
jgi:adenosylmethionine-8-amino-7-oxononanoate aminotransferase